MVHPRQHEGYTRKPYSGLSRSLVIAIDVGTTFSGVSYAILEPGEIPKIHGVTRFPGQEHVAGNSKIPSIIYYDKAGVTKAVGAEADNQSIIALAEDENWIKAELFKLRLRPRTMQLNMNGMRLSPLPKRKTPVHVFGDFLGYMYQCTRTFICDTHANGKNLWNSVEQDVQFVLSHPNGWEGPQQTRMRNAAVYGKLVPDSDAGRARIRFVTEGEASLHACVLNGLAKDVISNPSKHGFLIADAGGGTLDISAYAIKGTQPLTMEEIAPPDCIFAGSVFVSRRAREFLEDKLRNSKYGAAASLDHITRKFDETTKRLFRDRNELQFIPFGSPLDKDSSVGIRSGQLRLTGNEVANLFEPSVDATVTTIKRQIDISNGVIKSVFLVGGYAASPWLFSQLQERLAPFGVTVNRPDSQTSKAVADGAIGFYCDHHVSARMSKFMYGVEFLRELNPNDPEHLARKDKLCELPSGPKLLPDAFDCILARGVKVKESTVFTRKYCTELTNLSMLSVFEVEIWCFRGGNKIPQWINRHDDHFSTLCVVQADLSLLQGSSQMEPKVGKNGKKYWTIVFSVEIHFGLTEFKARMKWMDNGQVKYGPAVIVYNERGHRIEDEDLDVYPEDDQSVSTSRSEKTRSERYSPPSQPQTPINQAYAPSTTVGGSSSRHTSSPDPSRMERGSNRSYAPSVAPSTSARSGIGGSYAPSESRKGKDRESRYEDRTPSAPSEKSRHSHSKPPSVAGTETYGSSWGAPQGATSRSPSVHPTASRRTSHYGGEPVPPIPHDYAAPDQSWGGSPKPPGSFMDEQRQSQLWEQPAQPSPQRSFVDPPRSPYPASHTLEQVPPGSAPRSPFIHNQASPQPSIPAFDPAAPQFNIERPRSSLDSMYGDRPRSAFGDHPPSGFFGNDPPPAMFGDTGPAADAGLLGDPGAPAVFGEPPASVFGEVATTPTAEGAGQGDAWGLTAEPPAASPAPTTASGKKKKKKDKEKEKEAKSSPIAPSVKSAFGEEPVASPVVGGGLWGSKNPSPQTKSLSPLNPAAQVDPSPKSKHLSPLNPAAQIYEEQPADQPKDDWGFETENQGGSSGWDLNNANAGASQGGGDSGWNLGSNGGSGGGWGNLDSEPAAEYAPAHEPVPPEPTPVESTAVEEPEPMVAVAGKKKKKKGSTATTPAKSSPNPNMFDFAADDKVKEEERKAKEKKEKEEREQKEKEEEQRQEQEKKEQEKKEREEAAAAKAKEEEERARLAAEQAEAEKKRSEDEAAAAAPASIFDAPANSDTGGGDDGWNTPGGWNFGGTKTKKGKKGKSSGFGGVWGGGDDAQEAEAEAPPAASRANSGLFGFASSAASNFKFGFGSGDTGNTHDQNAEQLTSPIQLNEFETHTTPEATPIPAPEPPAAAEEPPAEGSPKSAQEGVHPPETPAGEEFNEEEWAHPMKAKKKKGKKGAVADDVPGTPAEEAAGGEGAGNDDGFSAPAAKKKKKGKK